MKNLFTVILCAALVLSLSAGLAACDKDEVEAEQVKIIYLGDSIAEAIAGPSPIQERVNYGYYGIIGQINDYQYDNRSVSGYQTKNLLNYLNRTDEDAYLVNSLLADADVIHISILGNDLLQYNFASMLVEIAAKEEFGADYAEEDIVKSIYLYNGGFTCKDKDGVSQPLKPSDGLKIYNNCLANALINIEAIVGILKDVNPDATIIFQNVYNPIDAEAELVSQELKDALKSINLKYDMSTDDGVAEVRALSKLMIGELDSTLNKYLEKDPDAFYIVDALTAFDEIYNSDKQRGMDLLFIDGVHPSDEGHAVLAGLTQDLLVKLGMAKADKGLAQYKELRVSQLERMYSGAKNALGETFNLDAAKAAVNGAATFDKVSELYFNAIENYTPTLYYSPTKIDADTSRVTNGSYVAETETYTLSNINLYNLSMSEEDLATFNSLSKTIIKMLEDKDIVLKSDGTMTLTVSVNLSSLLSLAVVAGISLDGMIAGADEEAVYNGSSTKGMGDRDMVELVIDYIEKLFPGIDVTGGHFGRTASLLTSSLGLEIDGIDALLSEEYTGYIDDEHPSETYESYIDYLFAYLQVYRYDSESGLHFRKMPEGLTEKLGSIEKLTIKFTGVYSLKTLTGKDGKTYSAVYVGQYDGDGSPWLILTKYQDSKGVMHVSTRAEVLGIKLTF